MNLNFFDWIREGVRQSVVLGVSDAVEDLGVPPNGSDLKQRLTEVVTKNEASLPKPSGNRRKKLGRSLGEIQNPQTKTA